MDYGFRSHAFEYGKACPGTELSRFASPDLGSGFYVFQITYSILIDLVAPNTGIRLIRTNDR
jgi:hypothetical protein